LHVVVGDDLGGHTHTLVGRLAGGPPAPRSAAGGRGLGGGRWQGHGPRDGSHLARGGDHEVQAINGDVDSDAHASEAEVALAQDGEEGFVGSLTGGEERGGDADPQDQVSWDEGSKEGCPKRPQALPPAPQPQLAPGRSPGRVGLGGSSPSSSRCPSHPAPPRTVC